MADEDLSRSFNASTAAGGSALSGKTVKYARSDLPDAQDKTGFYFPDSVIDPFVQEARAVLPQTSLIAKVTTASTNQPVFTLEDSREIIQAALDDFDSSLGKKARTIFDAGFDQAVADARTRKHPVNWKEIEVGGASKQWRLEEIEPRKSGEWMMQASTPANRPAIEHEFKSKDPSKPPEKFTDAANKNLYAVINYQFDGTLNTVIYMAHELGHTIADNNLQGKGKYKYSDNPEHMAETQAYFVQNILYDYISRHPELNDKYPGITQAASDHFTKTMAGSLGPLTGALDNNDSKNSVHESRSMKLLTGLGLYNAAKAATPETRRKIADAILCADGPKNIIQVLSVAGINDAQSLQKMAHTAVGRSVNEKLKMSPIPFRRPR